MLKIKDKNGKVVGVLTDDASEPEMTEKKPCCGNCKCGEEQVEEPEEEEEEEETEDVKVG